MFVGRSLLFLKKENTLSWAHRKSCISDKDVFKILFTFTYHFEKNYSLMKSVNIFLYFALLFN